MKGDRRSTVEELPLWNEEEEEPWRCWKHQPQPRYAVCPTCLRDRLLLLCPGCANVRPCACSPSTTSPSLCSSSDLARSTGASSIGVVGKLTNLIDSEAAFRRSRSVGVVIERSGSISGRQGRERRRGWLLPWPFSRAKEPEVVVLPRSTSVVVESTPGSIGGEGRWKGWNRYLASPMKAFRQRKSAKARVAQERSPLCRG
ncbi:uncharacterized protein [Typha angustifolia]|uniref:uncharacterized protein n=1 Tax=Typha angustifolia TaxID=59011 RepID=UPI003C2CB4CE